MFSFDLDSSEIYIYDEIGPARWGLIDAESVTNALSQMKGKLVTVRLNTPGGDVDEGIAIYNALTNHKGGVTTMVDSLAASMGSYLLQAGEQRIVASNAMVMIHDPWTISMGNATSLRKDADVLDKYSLRMIPHYAARSGKTDDEILQIMADESWYAGVEAVDAGFADSVDLGVNARALQPMVAGLHKVCSKMPAALATILEQNKAARLDDQLLSVGIDRKCMTVNAAKEKVKRMTDICM